MKKIPITVFLTEEKYETLIKMANKEGLAPGQIVASIIEKIGEKQLSLLKKECTKCHEIKSISNFYRKSGRYKYGRNPICKVCFKKHYKQWKNDNSLNEKYKELQHQWDKNNRDKRRAIDNKYKRKIRSTVEGKLCSCMSAGINVSLRGGKNGYHWEELVDFTLDQLKRHLEKKFLPGMSWDNRKEWHIDHIIPISAFNFTSPNDIDFKRCWNLKNLRPMWAVDNIRKHNKLSKPFQPSLSISLVV